jgi:hypothetical protein
MIALLSGKTKDEVFLKRIAPQVLEKLVDECVYELMADQFKIDIGDADIREFVQRYAQSVGITEEKFMEHLTKNGVRVTFMQMGRAQTIEYCIVMGAMSKKLLRVTEAQIQEKMEKIKADENRPQYSVLEIVFYPKDGVAASDTARKTYEELVRMCDQTPPISAFQSLARQLSQARTAQDGGYRGWCTDTDLGAVAAEVVKAMKVGTFSTPINVRPGEYRIFFLNDVKQPGMQPYSETQVEMRVVTVPFDPSMPEEEQAALQKRLAIILDSKSLDDFDGIASEYGYKAETVMRTLDVLPPDFELNRCIKPIFTGASLLLVMPLKKVLKPAILKLDKDAVQSALEHQLRANAAEKIFKNYKNRQLIVVDTRRL